MSKFVFVAVVLSLMSCKTQQTKSEVKVEVTPSDLTYNSRVLTSCRIKEFHEAILPTGVSNSEPETIDDFISFLRQKKRINRLEMKKAKASCPQCSEHKMWTETENSILKAIGNRASTIMLVVAGLGLVLFGWLGGVGIALVLGWTFLFWPAMFSVFTFSFIKSDYLKSQRFNYDDKVAPIVAEGIENPQVFDEIYRINPDDMKNIKIKQLGKRKFDISVEHYLDSLKSTLKSKVKLINEISDSRLAEIETIDKIAEHSISKSNFESNYRDVLRDQLLLKKKFIANVIEDFSKLEIGQKAIEELIKKQEKFESSLKNFYDEQIDMSYRLNRFTLTKSQSAQVAQALTNYKYAFGENQILDRILEETYRLRGEFENKCSYFTGIVVGNRPIPQNQ